MRVKEEQAELNAVPLTLEGSSVLHQMVRFRRDKWRELSPEKKTAIASELSAALGKPEETAFYSLLGHKADFLLVHFRDSFDSLKRVELKLASLRASDYFEVTHSFLSVVELGLYEASVKVYQSLAEKGVATHSDEWNRAVEEQVEQQKKAMHPRLYPEMPAHRYICFYPMDRKRGELKNWYRLPIAERQRQMHEHGMVGRRYAGTVKQIITGSIGFDDWEWGVDLFADDPLVFKKLIYEMRFDEVSADYALFGTFYVGIRVAAAQVGELLDGKLAVPEAR
jgi:peroxiredoxin